LDLRINVDASAEELDPRIVAIVSANALKSLVLAAPITDTSKPVLASWEIALASVETCIAAPPVAALFADASELAFDFSRPFASGFPAPRAVDCAKPDKPPSVWHNSPRRMIRNCEFIVKKWVCVTRF
jgi:hypothetical protein